MAEAELETHHDANDLKGHHEVVADAVVIGGGAGGAACAYQMASRGMKVVLLEEGHRWAPNTFPASYGWAINHIYADKGARVVEADSIYPIPGGRGVGGSTLINSAICYRAPDHILRGWAEQGLESLSPEKMAPLYELVEQTIGVVQMDPLQARSNNLFAKRGAEKLGMECAFIYRNAPGCVGCGVCHLGCPSGGKGSVDRNFVPMAEEFGAQIYSDSKVEKILVERGRAVGVEAVVRDIESDQPVGTLRVRAKAVVLAASTIGTPLLLQRQNLANSSGQVGQHLSIHPAVGTHGFVPEAINSWDGVPQAFAIFLDRQAGILLQTYNANPEIFFSQFPWSGIDGMRRMRRMKNLAMLGGLICDQPAGSVALGRGGRAKVSYQLADEDRLKLIRALRAVVRILFAAGATEVYAGGDGLELDKSEADALARLPDSLPEKEMHIYASHPMGTCRMGVDPKRSVVRPDGQTHDVPGLWIADASLMPSSLGVNPQMTVMSLGLHVGRSIAST